jgi:hypothetical protein
LKFSRRGFARPLQGAAAALDARHCNANARAQDFMIHEFARLLIEHHEIVKIFKIIAEATKSKK